MITNDKRVLEAIDILQKEGEPITYERIHALTLVSKRTVVRSVIRLKEKGYLEVTRPKPGLPYDYRILKQPPTPPPANGG